MTPDAAEQPRFTVTVAGRGEFPCANSQPILIGMERARMKLIPVGCRGGCCGVCRVQIHSGAYRLGRISTFHVAEEEQQQGISLACRTYPESDLEISVLGSRRT